MDLSTWRIRVTRHALQRWRERAAAYADAPAHDLIAAVKRSTVCELDELPEVIAERLPKPITSVAGRLYSVLDACVFVLAPDVSGSGLAVITVLVFDAGKRLDQAVIRIKAKLAARRKEVDDAVSQAVSDSIKKMSAYYEGIVVSMREAHERQKCSMQAELELTRKLYHDCKRHLCDIMQLQDDGIPQVVYDN